MTGIIAPIYGGTAAPPGVVAIENMSIDSDNESPASYSLLSSGDIEIDGSGVGAPGTDDWIAPKSGMAGFEARATLVAGQVNTGSSPLSAWLNLGTGCGWGCKIANPSGPAPFADLTIEIRPVGGVTADSASIHLSAVFLG